MTQLLQQRLQPNRLQTGEPRNRAAKPEDRKRDEKEFLTYFARLAEGLTQELLARLHNEELPTHEIQAWKSNVSDFHQLLTRLSKSQLSGDYVADVIQRYGQLAKNKGNTLNARAEVAREYESMEEFWADVKEQSRGNSEQTYWDTYEHGRRRQLEALLACTYGSEDALLLNSGMSGIAAVCEMLNLRPGDTIVTGERSYFETSDFLHRFFSERGIHIERVPVGNTQKVISTLKQTNPRLVIMETATNAPSVDVPADIPAWLNAAKQALFLIDNSVQSHLTRWFSIVPNDRARILVLESGVKYLTHHCMAGVLYGNRETLERARTYARLAGQQLQEKAFNFINVTEIEHLPEKLARHSSNARLFHQALQPYSRYFSLINLLDSTSSRESANTIFNGNVGSLIFVALPVNSKVKTEDVKIAHRRLLDRWRAVANENRLKVEIRCGFGWSQTTARVYESDFLNQPDAPTFLRISVGIEPQSIIVALAKILGEAAKCD